MKNKIYLKNVISLLQELSDYQFQHDIWMNTNNPKGLVCSFSEAVNMLDDEVVKDFLEEGEIIVDRKVTQALKELYTALDVVNEYRTDKEIVNDPLMDVVRKKAAHVLELIAASDFKENTLRIVEPGEA